MEKNIPGRENRMGAMLNTWKHTELPEKQQPCGLHGAQMGEYGR